ncbi:MAG TPA: hypothetical protein VFV68_08810 [Agriterribacter sp.]|nr:hypothetical protein [Agriterribacter sp.]
MELAEQRNLQALFIRIELSYNSASYKGDGATASGLVDTSSVILKYQLKQQNISPSLSVLYNFVNRQTYKVYAGVGVAYNFSSYPENKLTTIKPGNISKEFENYIVPSKHWVTINATLGTRITKHLDAAVKADVYGSFTNYPTFSLNSNTYTAQLRWFFN